MGDIVNDNINIKITLQNIPREVSLKLAEMHKAGILGYYISNLIISNEYSRSKGTKVPKIVTGESLELDPKKIVPNNKEGKGYEDKKNDVVPGIDKEYIELMKEELRKELQEDMRKENPEIVQEDFKEPGIMGSEKEELKEESEGSITYEDDAEDFINDLMSI